MSELVIGHDHGFGRGRSGDAETLRALGAELGFAVDVVGPVDAGGQQVSTAGSAVPWPGATPARRPAAGPALTPCTAASRRERPRAAAGRADHQSGRNSAGETSATGRRHAVRVEWRGGTADGMMNQGGRPTFGEVGRTLEAHLFGGWTAICTASTSGWRGSGGSGTSAASIRPRH